jgi:hypothetical protein
MRQPNWNPPASQRLKQDSPPKMPTLAAELTAGLA